MIAKITSQRRKIGPLSFLVYGVSWYDFQQLPGGMEICTGPVGLDLVHVYRGTCCEEGL